MADENGRPGAWEYTRRLAHVTIFVMGGISVWALTSILAVKESVHDVKESVGDLKGDLKVISTVQGTSNERMDRIAGAVKDMKEDVGQLQSDVAVLKSVSLRPK